MGFFLASEGRYLECQRITLALDSTHKYDTVSRAEYVIVTRIRYVIVSTNTIARRPQSSWVCGGGPRSKRSLVSRWGRTGGCTKAKPAAGRWLHAVNR